MTYEEAIKILEVNVICSPKATQFKEAVEVVTNEINRQKADIERLRMQQSELIADYKQIAINAMKKFVERFKTKLSNFEYRDENPNMKQKGEWILHEVIPIEVDNLLKEMEVSE